MAARQRPERSPGIERFLAEYLGTIANPVPFGGRASELDALDAWLTDAPEPCLLLTAPAGRGKSALLVRWVERVRTRPGIVIVFLPISIRFRTNLARSVLPALIAGVAAAHRIPAPGQFDASIASWKATLSELLARPPPASTQIVLVLDGIDEAADWEADQEMFPLELPPGVRVVASARSGEQDTDTAHWLRILGWDIRDLSRAMRLSALTPEGVADVLVRMGVPLDRLGRRVDIVAEIHRLTEGDPLLVGLYVGDLWTKGNDVTRLTPASLAAIRPGLEGYFDRWWADQRKLWKGEAPLKELSLSMVVNLLASALGPLSRDDALKLLPPEAQLRTSLALAETVAPLSRFLVGDGVQVGYAFSHPRLAAYFYGRMGADERVRWEAHFLAWGREVLARLAQDPPTERDRYAVQFYGAHLVRAEAAVEDLMALVDLQWMRAWARLGGGHAGFIADVARAHQRAVKANHQAVAAGVKPRLDWEVRCTLWQTSINSLALEIPTELTIALIEDGLWTVADGIEHARRLPSIQRRATAIRTLLEALPDAPQDELFAEAVRVAAAAAETEAWNTVFTTLARYLPDTFQVEVIPDAPLRKLDDRLLREAVQQNSDLETLLHRLNRDMEAHLGMLVHIDGERPEGTFSAGADHHGRLVAIAWAAAPDNELRREMPESLFQPEAMSHYHIHPTSNLLRAMGYLLQIHGEPVVVRTSNAAERGRGDAAHLFIPGDRLTREAVAALSTLPPETRAETLAALTATAAPEVVLFAALLLPPTARLGLLRTAVAAFARRGPWNELFGALSTALEQPVPSNRRQAVEALAPGVRELLAQLAMASTVDHEPAPEPEPEHREIAIDLTTAISRFVADDMREDRHEWLMLGLRRLPETERAAAVEGLIGEAQGIDDNEVRREFLADVIAADPRPAEPLAPELALELLIGTAPRPTSLPDSVVRRILLTLPRIRGAMAPAQLTAIVSRFKLDGQAALLVLGALPPELHQPLSRTLPDLFDAPPDDVAEGLTLDDIDDDDDDDLAMAMMFLPLFKLAGPAWRAPLETTLQTSSCALRDRIYALLGLGASDDRVRAQLLTQRSQDSNMAPAWRTILAVVLDGPGEGSIDAARVEIERLGRIECALACALLAPYAPAIAFEVVCARFEGEPRKVLLAQLLPHLSRAPRDAAIDELLATAGNLLDHEINPIRLWQLVRVAFEDERSLLLVGSLRSLACLSSGAEGRGQTLALAAGYLTRVRRPRVLRKAVQQGCASISDADERASAMYAIATALPDEELWSILDDSTNGLFTKLEGVIPDLTGRWRADRAWLIEHAPLDHSEQVERILEIIPDDHLDAALPAILEVPEHDSQQIVEKVAPRVRGSAAAALIRIIEADSDARNRLGRIGRLLDKVRPEAVAVFEAGWTSIALGVARSWATPHDTAVLQHEILAAAPALSVHARSTIGDMVRLIGSTALRVGFLAGVFPVLPSEIGSAIVRETIEACRQIKMRRDRLALLLELARAIRGPARRAILEEALRTTQTIDDDPERLELLVALAPWADETVKEELLVELAEADATLRSRLLSRLSPHLQEPERSAAARSALAAATIDGWFHQAEAIRAVSAHLDGTALPELFAAVDAIPFERDRAHALCIIAPLLDRALLDGARRSIRRMCSDMHRVTALIGLTDYLAPEALREELAAPELCDPAAIARLAVARLRHVHDSERAAAIDHAVDAIRACEIYRGRRGDLLELAAVVPPRLIPALVEAARSGGGPEDFVAAVGAVCARDDVGDRETMVAEAHAALPAIADCEQRARALVALARSLPADRVAEETRAALAAARLSWSVRKRVGAVAAMRHLLPPEVLRDELDVVLAHPDRDTRLATLELIGSALPESVQREAIRRISARTSDTQGEELMALARSLPASLAPDLLAAARLVRNDDLKSQLVSMMSNKPAVLPPLEHYRRLSHSLHVLASGTRGGFLRSLGALIPMLVDLGGPEVARASARCLVEAGSWW